MEETVENVIEQDDAAMDADMGGNTDYYRSQEEVDRAFKKRLERERRKWEASLKERSGEKAEALEDKRAGDEQQAKSSEDIVNEQLGEIESELEPYLKNIEAEGEMPSEQEEDDYETEAFVESVLKEVSELEQLYEDLDLTEELSNPLFTHMLKEGQPLKKVYDYFKPQKSRDAVYKEVEREVTEHIRARNAKPSSIAYANASSASYDISRLSQRDIEEIDRRVKRGERVVL